MNTQPQKLFLLLIIGGTFLLLVIAYLSLAPLNDTGLQPQAAADQCLQYMGYFNKATLFIYVVLIFISNLIFRNTWKGISLFYSWLFYSVFCLFSYIYMAETFFHFKQSSGLWMGEFSVAGFLGIILSIIAAIAAIINYFVLKQVFKKMN